MSVTVSTQPAHGTVAISGGSIPCDGTGHTGTVEVTIDPDAPPGALNFELMAETPIEMSCIANGSVSVEELVNLTFDGVCDEDETEAGGLLCINDDDDNDNGIPDLNETGPDPDIVLLTVSAQGGLNGPVTLSTTGGNRVKLYQDAGRATVITLPKTWDASELPKTLYVEGVQVSGGVRDVELQLEYTGPGGPCEDRVKLTVARVELDIDSNNDGTIDVTNGPSGTDDPIEDGAPGKILCLDSPMAIPGKFSIDPAFVPGTITIVATGPGVIELYRDPALTNAIPLGTPIPVDDLASVGYFKGTTAGEVTLALQLNLSIPQCQDEVVLTVRARFTGDPFPNTVFTATNTSLMIDQSEPEGAWGNINGIDLVGFGKDPPPAVAWYPIVDVQASGPHVSCDQFTVGAVQAVIAWEATYTYDDGNRRWLGTIPSLDQYAGMPGPDAFYSTASSKVMQGCGTTGTLAFEDTPYVADRWLNACPGKVGLLQSITFADSFETWLVALHRPSGCYTVIKHFSWAQNAESVSVDPLGMTMEWISSTSANPVDDGPGGTPILQPPAFNNTIGVQCLP